MTRTAREALIAELLGDLDKLIERTEELSKQFAATASQTTHALNEATERYRAVVASYTEAAKADLSAHTIRATADACSKAAEEHSTALRAIVREAIEREVNRPTIQLGEMLIAATREFQQAKRTRFAETIALATCSAVLASGFTWLLLR